MAIFKRKSEDNIAAASYLFAERLYTPAIHCSYYSCFQLSKYLLNERGKNYGIQDKECGGYSSHNYIINETKKVITDSSKYDRSMKTLKALRAKADYQNSQILDSDAQKALDIAKNTINLIKI